MGVYGRLADFLRTKCGPRAGQHDHEEPAVGRAYGLSRAPVVWSPRGPTRSAPAPAHRPGSQVPARRPDQPTSAAMPARAGTAAPAPPGERPCRPRPSGQRPSPGRARKRAQRALPQRDPGGSSRGMRLFVDAEPERKTHVTRGWKDSPRERADRGRQVVWPGCVHAWLCTPEFGGGSRA